MALTDEHGRLIVRMARRTVDQVVRSSDPPKGEESNHPFLREPRGAFVTLNAVDGGLRGCIGFPYPVKQLGQAVVEAAIGASTQDPRFPRVEPFELDRILVEVSALTRPETLSTTSRKDLPGLVRIGADGLIVTGYGYSGLLLPQVATEYRLKPEDFLSETCMKAGLMPDSWLSNRVSVQRFQAEVFGETSPQGEVEKKLD